MNIKKVLANTIFLCACALVHLCSIGFCQNLQVTAVNVLDSAGRQRTDFSSSESVTLEILCYNSTEIDKIGFRFYILSPNNQQVLSQEGNSAVGKIGPGGSRLINIPLKFYTGPGTYTFKGEAFTVTETVSQTAKFNVYSPVITLTYPVNNARDLVDQPLTFRWVASGATKYRIQVSDTNSFYRPLWESFVFDTGATYPISPTDPLQQLASGTIYWWRVEGQDDAGNVVAATPIPFSFSMKAQNVVVTSRELAVVDIRLNDATTSESTKIDVDIKNQGGQPETDIQVDLYLNGIAVIPTQRISIINTGETKTITFDCGKQERGTVQVQASLNFMDDNPRNNMISKVVNIKYAGGIITPPPVTPPPIVTPPPTISTTTTPVVPTVSIPSTTTVIVPPVIPKEKAKILGKVSDSEETGKGIDDAEVKYNGVLSGKTVTKEGGQYKIEGLAKGEYRLVVAHPDYETSQVVTVNVDDNKAYPNTDFKLVLTRWSPGAIWDIIKSMLTDNMLDKLAGYKMTAIEAKNDKVLQKVVRQLIKGKAKIVEIKVE